MRMNGRCWLLGYCSFFYGMQQPTPFVENLRQAIDKKDQGIIIRQCTQRLQQLREAMGQKNFSLLAHSLSTSALNRYRKEALAYAVHHTPAYPALCVTLHDGTTHSLKIDTDDLLAYSIVRLIESEVDSFNLVACLQNEMRE